MTFQTTKTFCQDADTVISFFQYNSSVTFTCPEITLAYENAFGGDILNTKSGDIHTLRMRYSNHFINLILIGLDFSDSDHLLENFRKATLKLGTRLNELNSGVVFIDNFESLNYIDNKELARQFASALPLCDYTFDKYKAKKADYTKKSIFVHVSEESSALEDAFSEGANIAKGICIARDLTNEPSDILTPEELANRAVSFGNEYGFEVEVFDKEACEKMGMTAFLTVSRGCAYEPKLIVMRYHGDKDSYNAGNASMGVIGKGLCYDSGGLFLKSGASMEHSKADMAGGAAVIGAMCALAMNKVKKNVTAVVAACENMLDGNGYRNGDIVHTMAGKSVFVGSTDAEGRLTLADAITYMIQHENVDNIIELSTLTGSCANFFSDVCCGVLTTDDKLFEKLSANSDICGEKYWRIPHFDEYREFIKSDVADLHNTSTSGAGGICAGLFLDEFKEDKPFVHLDIAGMTFTSKKRDGYPKGGTGYGVKTVYNYIKE